MREKQQFIDASKNYVFCMKKEWKTGLMFKTIGIFSIYGWFHCTKSVIDFQKKSENSCYMDILL